MDSTNEFSFILKPSLITGAGVGVFAAHDIKAGAKLALFPENYSSRIRYENETPEPFIHHCVAQADGTWRGPEDFRRMEIGWYLNHSTTPNAINKPDSYYSLQDIKQDEEIVIDYNNLGEPEDKKEDYYRQPS
jgi:SET domain-containing protein